MNLYEVALNNKHAAIYPGKQNPVIVHADSVSVGVSNSGAVVDRWVKFYTVDNGPVSPDKSRSKLVYTVLDEYVVYIRDLGVAPPESQSPLNADALKSTAARSPRWFAGEGPPPSSLTDVSPGDFYTDSVTGKYYEMSWEGTGDASGPQELDLKHEPPVGTVLRLYYKIGESADEILVHLNKGWLRAADGYIGVWNPYVYDMVHTVAKIEVAEFRTVRPISSAMSAKSISAPPRRREKVVTARESSDKEKMRIAAEKAAALKERVRLTTLETKIREVQEKAAVWESQPHLRPKDEEVIKEILTVLKNGD